MVAVLTFFPSITCARIQNGCIILITHNKAVNLVEYLESFWNHETGNTFIMSCEKANEKNKCPPIKSENKLLFTLSRRSKRPTTPKIGRVVLASTLILQEI